MTALTAARLVDDDGSGSEVLRLDGSLGVILTNLDLGFPEVRSVTTSRTGQDGTLDNTQFVGSRSVVAEILLPASNWYAVEDQLRAALHPGYRYYLHVLRDGWTEERRILVRGATYTPSASTFPKTAQMGWAGLTGTMEGSVQSVTLQPTFSDNEGGIATPTALPAAFNPGYNPGAATVTVNGTANTPVTATIYGPCTNPVLFLAGAQARLAFNTTIAAGDFLQVDFEARTALLNNNPLLSMYGYLDFVQSSWWSLTPGAHQVAFNPSLAGGSCTAILSWRPRFL